MPQISTPASSVLALILCSAGQALGDEWQVDLGEPEVLLESGAHELHYFPDAHLTFLDRGDEKRLFLVAGVSTWLMQGEDMRSLEPVAQVLKPGEPGSFDNGYAGIFGAYDDNESGELLAFYHAEDHEEMGKLPNGANGFYASVCLAVSRDSGLSFEKLGPVLTGSLPKDTGGRTDQGVGEGAIVADPAGEYLHCYYSDHSRVDGRGVQICLARSPIEDAGRPGTWRKYHDGAFSEPGLGGRDTPVLSMRHADADAVFPHVQYVEALGKYLMVFSIVAYADLRTNSPETSGIYLSSSEDGINWPEPEPVLHALSIPRPEQELAWHAMLDIEAIEDGELRGWLYYAYSERWGWAEPRKPHYLVGRPITVRVGP